MNLDVVTVGKAGFDIFLSGKELKPGLVSRDDMLNLQNNHSYDAEHSVYEIGGSAINSAITFARQGIKTGCIARTGKDYLASQIKAVIKRENISPELLVNIPEHHTDLDVHIVTERANEIVISYQNSNDSLRAKDLKFPDLYARLLYIAEVPNDFKAFKYLAELAKISGAEIWANLNDLKFYKRKQLNYVLSNLTGLMMPIHFATRLFNDVTDEREIIRQVLAFGPKSVLLYDVYNEAYASVDKAFYQSGTYKNINPLDKTGSEDVFAAAFAAGIFQGKSVTEALTLASANACSVLEVFGARSGILKKPAIRPMNIIIGEI